jgi:RNA polymerase sigma-70 factor (ECF subfamily)
MNDQRKTFETIYLEHRGLVYQMCMGYVKGDSALARDLSQDIFINIWNAIPGFKGGSSYKTWIYRITVNTCLQHLRTEKRATRVSISEGIVAHIDTSTDPKNELDTKLFDAIGKLPEVERLIIMMVLDDLGYDEIARIIGIEETNLRVRIHRIKKKLKEILSHER